MASLLSFSLADTDVSSSARHHRTTTKNERRLAHKATRVWVRTKVGVISCSSDNLHFQQLMMVVNGYLV